MICNFFSHISLLFDKQVIFINTPMQFINLVELININNNFELRNLKKKIFLCNNEINDATKIKEIIHKYKLKKYRIIKSNNKFLKLIIIIFLSFRNIFLPKLPLLILGDYDSPFSLRFIKMAKKIIFLDDGTSTLDYIIKSKKLKELNKNCHFFSFFDKNIIKTQNYLSNKFNFFSQKIKKKSKNKKFIIIAGSPGVERKFITMDQKLFFLQKICKIYKDYDIHYFMHPKEAQVNYKKLKFIKFIKSSLTLELYIITLKFIPHAIIGWNSTSFVVLKKIYGSKLKLINFHLDLIKKNRLNHYSKNILPRFLKIIRYFRNYLNITTVFIKYKE